MKIINNRQGKDLPKEFQVKLKGILESEHSHLVVTKASIDKCDGDGLEKLFLG